MEIIKVYKENWPDVRLVGKRYTNRERDEFGTFGRYWQQWFQEGWFDALKQCESIPGVSEDYLGAMRITGEDGDFEYWIGALFGPNTRVPDGFESVEISVDEIGVCWLYGNDASGELYSIEAFQLSVAALSEQGWKFSEKGWFFERYNCPRFTTPDEKGNVILDICIRLVSEPQNG